MKALLWAKGKLYAVGAILLSILAVIVRLKQLEHQRDKARARERVAKAELKVERSNQAISKKTKEERVEQREKAVEQILKGEVPDSLGDDINTGWD